MYWQSKILKTLLNWKPQFAEQLVKIIYEKKTQRNIRISAHICPKMYRMGKEQKAGHKAMDS